MIVYVVMEEQDAYPEEGGGLQGISKIFQKEEDAKAYRKKMADAYSFGNYGDYYYHIEEWIVE